MSAYFFWEIIAIKWGHDILCAPRIMPIFEDHSQKTTFSYPENLQKQISHLPIFYVQAKKWFYPLVSPCCLNPTWDGPTLISKRPFLLWQTLTNECKVYAIKELRSSFLSRIHLRRRFAIFWILNAIEWNWEYQWFLNDLSSITTNWLPTKSHQKQNLLSFRKTRG